MVTYLEGDATRVQAGQRILIAHVVNNAGFWGKGFTSALDRMSPQPKRTYQAWWDTYHLPKGSASNQMLGQYLAAVIDSHVSVVHMCAQDGISHHGKRTVDYSALAVCGE